MEDDVSVPTKIADEVSSHLHCPICKTLYRDPVINIRCGHTFCRKCAFSTTHCPVDNAHCDTSQLVINRLVVGQIDDLRIFCRYGLIKDGDAWQEDPSGCTEKIQFGKRQEHETDCLFAIVRCPNAEECGTFRRSELQRHLQQCTFTPCIHKPAGCEFTGTLVSVEEHIRSCGYQDSKSVGPEVIQKMVNLQQTNQKLEQQVSTLTKRVVDLESVRDDMASQLSTCNSCIQALQQKYNDLHATVESMLNTRRPVSYGSQLSLAESTTGFQRRRTSSPGSPNGVVKYERWEMPFQFKCIGTLRGHQDVVWCLTAYKGRLYSSGADGQIKVWDLEQLARGCIQTLSGHTATVYCSSVSDGCLYTAGDDHTIRVWDTESGGSVKTLENAHDNIICAMTTTKEYLFTSSFSLIKVWELKTLALKQVLSGLHHWVRALAFSYKKDKLYSGSHNAINVWDCTDSFAALGTIEHEFGSVHSLAVTQTYIIAGNAGTYNQNIQLFDATTHKHVTNLCGHIGTVTSLAVPPSGRFLFSGSHDSNVQLWSLEKMLPIQTLSRHQASVNSLTLYGNILLSGSEDHEIKVFRYFQLQHGQF
ncbi:E3 ubiquitin-protein ligase TRAF7-like isoform X1 [Haliotis cracherodii]|uniref:E3 ubiquitin-protein ligase TRAF7-like isoform X1 n=1 Tax=Haliotis cracherodii TaxID=6455 RepID=UPI0039ECD106